MAQYNRKDRFYRKAKEEGYQSRAAYKLLEINAKYNILKPGFKVLDLGAWPGGWLQIISKSVGNNGLVIGIDLKSIEGISAINIKTISGDAADTQNLASAMALAGGKFDLVVSDMSPKLTGIKEVDHAQSVALYELAVTVASATLKPSGGIVIKVFKSGETEAFVKKTRSLFNNLIRLELESSRKTSDEFYLLGVGFKG